MKKILISGVLAASLLVFSYNSLSWGQAEEKKTLSAEEAAEAQKKLEEAQQKLKKAVKNVPKVDNAGSITGVVTCQKMRNNADAVVFIEKVGENKFDPPAEHAIVDQLNLTYVPRVLAMQKGTTIDFPNSDAVRHNVFSPPTAAIQFNLGTYPTGVVKEVLFDIVGETPLLCNVHAEMAGYVVTFENPYFAITDKDGNYTIEGVPAGKYVVKTWHEKLKELSQEVTVEPGNAATANFELKRRR
ncbi:MAG TPA: carboxypeptidase regulatory-like domain-containing protein [Candidatus Wujingus californicus]|uniref:carboxypeptidase regulatory-like domain-containing protein n=1 Tax=Candidatus Wujingus californicus TaxID=3367618 RepID=UPI001D88DFE2|nr:carboxypeptidase regulatory-like domain-containing protein [Planctomycetota bacterium]MDO8131246.1 carboxypeptidase regulatory-like domain-containing protein [Candidatus Brocadiales bacterium]